MINTPTITGCLFGPYKDDWRLRLTMRLCTRLYRKYLWFQDYTPQEQVQIASCLSALLLVRRLCRSGLKKGKALKVAEVPTSTYYRWLAAYKADGLAGLCHKSRARHNLPARTVRTAEVIEKVRLWRLAAPDCQEVICERLRREDHQVGVTTVWKIIRELKAQNKIPGGYSGQPRGKRSFKGHAKRRWKKPAKVFGRFEVDHMHVYQDGACYKVFTGRETVSNAIYAMGCVKATAASAVRFAFYLMERFPDPVVEFQVDGGGEFRGEFEAFCQQRDIGLYVIPPKSPKHNSKVENANGTLRRSLFHFRNDIVFDMAGLNEALENFTRRYNNRPNLALSYRDEHGRLRYHTPNEYIRAFQQSADGKPS